VNFLNQINTVLLNPTHRQSIEGKSVGVIDDFTVLGYSAECARKILFQDGASKGISLKVGETKPR
jgi:hypothetical protein